MINIWYNEKSLMGCGAIVESITPLPRPARNVETVTIPGRSEVLHIDDGTLQPVQRSIVVTVRSLDDKIRVDKWCIISGWLRIENEPAWAYKATCSFGTTWEQPSKTVWRGTITMELQPYMYRQPTKEKIPLTSAKTIFNQFETESLPLFHIEGSGAVSFMVGTQAVTLDNVDGYIDIDSDAQVAHKDGASMTSIMHGDFPMLLPGGNAVSWTGNVTKFVITPRWRESM